jgi:REP element-mobilizing transposase RayT
MSEKYKFNNPDGIYFVTLTIVRWIDLFTRPEFKHILIDALSHCQNEKGLVIYAYVVMPSHLHMIVSTKKTPLSAILRDIKKFTSKKFIKEMNFFNESRKEWLLEAFKSEANKVKRITSFKVWKDGNHPVELEGNAMIDQRLEYIHNNPVESEIVDEPESYLYSSARDYAGIKGILEVVLMD